MKTSLHCQARRGPEAALAEAARSHKLDDPARVGEAVDQVHLRARIERFGQLAHEAEPVDDHARAKAVEVRLELWLALHRVHVLVTEARLAVDPVDDPA